MIALYLSPLYLLLLLYLYRWIMLWLGSGSPLLLHLTARIGVGVVFFGVALCIAVAFFLPASEPKRILKLISNYWLGILLYLSMTVIAADLVRLLLRYVILRRSIAKTGFSSFIFLLTGFACTLTLLVVTAVGIYSASHTVVTDYDITVHKSGGRLNTLKIALVADLHLGYNIGCSMMEQMVSKINALEPDLVVIAGDIFDNEFEALEDPERLAEILSGIESRYGVYACYGNHDIEEPILAGFTFGSQKEKAASPEMDQFLIDSGIINLRDEYVLIDDSIYLYGRPDYERPGAGITTRRSASELMAVMDPDKPVIVLEHEPRELDELSAAGADIDLNGHVHDGQLFPVNIITRLVWENSYGYLQKGDMHNIVTSGVGLFGPNMRVGTKSEICNITVHFEN